MIAKALAQETPVIFLDEPTAFLDFPSKAEMMRILRHLAHKERKTVMLSTHDINMALDLADSLWLVDKHIGNRHHIRAGRIRRSCPLLCVPRHILRQSGDAVHHQKMILLIHFEIKNG